jgi:2-methylisocitrate lyase-like PEP mutase family enzyme
MRTITRSAPGPHLANMVEGGGKTPILPAGELQALGYTIAIYPISTWTASIKAMQEVLAVLREDGITTRYSSRMVSFQEMFETVGRSRFAELEQKYSAS